MSAYWVSLLLLAVAPTGSEPDLDANRSPVSFADRSDVSVENAWSNNTSVLESPVGDRTPYPIELAVALQLADSQNPQIAIARERIRQSRAEYLAAKVLWLPSIQAGATVALHEGTIQETIGRVIETDRNSLQVGAGSAAFGAGMPMIPGVAAEFHLADAIFQPLAANQRVEATRNVARAVTNDTLFEVADSYLGLWRESLFVAIANEALANTKTLQLLTDAYAESGAGLRSDTERVRAEVGIRGTEELRMREAYFLASARVVRLLHLEPTVLLAPIERVPYPMELVSHHCPLSELVAVAKTSRPELQAAHQQTAEANYLMKREKYAPLVPNVSVGLSGTGFGGSGGPASYQFSDRTDFQAIAYWQLRNLGIGDKAACDNRASQVRQKCLEQQRVSDIISQQVADAQAQLHFRHAQIEIAQAAMSAAVMSYQQNVDRIEGAQGLPIEVLQSIQALAAARRDYVRAVIDYNIAQFAMQRALGQFLGGEPIGTSSPECNAWQPIPQPAH